MKIANVPQLTANTKTLQVDDDLSDISGHTDRTFPVADDDDEDWCDSNEIQRTDSQHVNTSSNSGELPFNQQKKYQQHDYFLNNTLNAFCCETFLCGKSIMSQEKTKYNYTTILSWSIAAAKTSPRFYRFFTPAFDYTMLLLGMYAYNYVCTVITQTIALPIIVAVVVIVSITRDYIYMLLFKELIPKDKLTYTPTLQDLKACVKTPTTIILFLSVLLNLDFMYIAKIESLDTIMLVWIEFMAMIAAVDISMCLLHDWMHRSSEAFKNLHQEHHSSKKNTQALSALRFTTIDLFIENGIAPIFVLVVKKGFGLPVQLDLASFVLFGISQIAWHSCNPHSVVYFNPVLDYCFKTNIAHSLHHAIPSLHISTLPLQHRFDKERHRDIALYEKTFQVDLGYSWPVKNKTS